MNNVSDDGEAKPAHAPESNLKEVSQETHAALRNTSPALLAAFCVAVVLSVLYRFAYGQWQSVPSFMSTLLLVAAAAMPLAEWETESASSKNGATLGFLVGGALGLGYGLMTAALIQCIFFTACVGLAVGWLLSRYGLISVPDNISQQAVIRTSAATFIATVVLHVAGVMAPARVKAVVNTQSASEPAPVSSIAGKGQSTPPEVAGSSDATSKSPEPKSQSPQAAGKVVETVPAVASEKVQPARQPPKDEVKRGFFGPIKLAYKKRVDLCDNPDAHKNTEMVMEVKTERILLRNSNGDVSLMSCTVFYGDGSFEMQFEIPDDVKSPNFKAGQYLNVTFVFSGHVGMPSRVTKITRN